MRAQEMCFKTVNGKEACTTSPHLKGVVTPQKSTFWKEIREGAIFDCVFQETLPYAFQKRCVNVDLMPFISFGRSFV